MTSNLRNAKKPYFVVDEGECYNAFGVNMFDKRTGYLEGFEDEPGYHFDDFDIIAWFNTWDEAIDYSDEMNDKL